ncbi:putative proline racemase [Thelonectria olida]|uniref:trans-L-3-hydroxyproline dehydratase n=1 Tax=Thelonectria olida TaxID=1576542 RepID=A0A9P8VVV9_9HYPO|nr:putative proline racemase [Thelonectria olida]
MPAFTYTPENGSRAVNVNGTIHCVDMHTTGQPTRIVYSGFPDITGTLEEQRSTARKHHDHIRRRLILEPRGHHDMYGAVLRSSTELVDRDEADMGILFLTNDGYSNMCGHATIALGRFLVDTHDLEIFPKRKNLLVDGGGIHIRLHVPCGVVHVMVQTLEDGRSDPSKPVSFVSVPSFASGIKIPIHIPHDRRWRVGKGINKINVDFAYGGAFFCMVEASGLYSDKDDATLSGAKLQDLDEAAFTIIDLINESLHLRKYVTHPGTATTAELGKIFALLMIYKGLGLSDSGSLGVDTGVCFFDNHQIDRSPTGSAVAARMALAYTKGEVRRGEAWTYQSILSNAYGGTGSFVGKVVDDTCNDSVRVALEGKAYYTGTHCFFVEPGDILGDDGFAMEAL